LQSLSLYIHIPFCREHCTYCAFNTYFDREALYGLLADAIVAEIRYAGRMAAHYSVATVYLGGGTPSVLSVEELSKILDAVFREFSVAGDAEISIEVNPADARRDYLEGLRDCGFNRLSIGMQSAVDRELMLFARRHSANGVVDAIQAGRGAGFDDISLDLIYGTPGQTRADWLYSLQQAIGLEPDHLSLYALELKGNTSLTRQVKRGELLFPDDDQFADRYDTATRALAQSGYDQYEISNWSRPGRQSQHNLQYWRSQPYLGFGPGAHGYADATRTSTVLLPERYINRMQMNPEPVEFPRTPATAKAVRLDRATQVQDALIMGLRLTREGIQRRAFRERFGVDVVDIHQPVVDRLVALGMVTYDDRALRVTEAGRYLLNAILVELL
jgi:oxygen-independent coproporphyrinogen III oxidase